jgi:hypothetical protein
LSLDIIAHGTDLSIRSLQSVQTFGECSARGAPNPHEQTLLPAHASVAIRMLRAGNEKEV